MAVSLGKMVYITGLSRSGTSMIAGMFGVHGVWSGPTEPGNRINQKGFWESTKFKQLVQQAQPGWEQEWYSYMLSNGYVGGPWMAKSGMQYLDTVKVFNPVIVKCYRDTQKIIESRVRAKWVAAPVRVEEWQEQLKKIEGWEVRSDYVANLDFSDFLPIFAEIGVEFDYDKAKNWVDPQLFHNRR